MKLDLVVRATRGNMSAPDRQLIGEFLRTLVIPTRGPVGKQRVCASRNRGCALSESSAPEPPLLLQSAGFLCTFPTSPAVLFLAQTEQHRAKNQGSWRGLLGPYCSRSSKSSKACKARGKVAGCRLTCRLLGGFSNSNAQLPYG